LEILIRKLLIKKNEFIYGYFLICKCKFAQVTLIYMYCLLKQLELSIKQVNDDLSRKILRCIQKLMTLKKLWPVKNNIKGICVLIKDKQVICCLF
jgi:hypothetical protein